MNKKGSFISLFVLIVVVFVVVLFSVVMLYASNQTLDKLHKTLDDVALFENTNASQVIDDTFGAVPQSYNHLTWITVMLIFGMIISILYGSYKVRTQPIYFLPYFLITGIAIVVSVIIANSYEDIIQNNILAGTFASFTGANHFLLFLPVYIGIVGVVGGIIMFISWVTRPEGEGAYAYYGY